MSKVKPKQRLFLQKGKKLQEETGDEIEKRKKQQRREGRKRKRIFHTYKRNPAW